MGSKTGKRCGEGKRQGKKEEEQRGWKERGKKEKGENQLKYRHFDKILKIWGYHTHATSLIRTKFGMQEWVHGVLFHPKFHFDRFTVCHA